MPWRRAAVSAGGAEPWDRPPAGQCVVRFHSIAQSTAGASHSSGGDAEQQLAVLVVEVEQLASQLSQAMLRAAAERIQAEADQTV